MREYHVRSGRWKAGLVRRSSRKRFATEERTKRKCEVTAAGSAKDSSRKISDTAICEFERYLHREGKKKSTVDKYLRDVRSFQIWLRQSTEERGIVERETAGQWRDFLCGSGYAPVTVNAMLTSLNLFSGFRAGRNAEQRRCGFSAVFSGVRKRSFSAGNMNDWSKRQKRREKNAWRCCWRRYAPPESGSAR